MTCQHCKFWEEEKKSYASFAFGKCKRIKMYDDATTWDSEGRRVLLSKDELAWVQDASDYYAVLNTAPDFDCILMEKK